LALSFLPKENHKGVQVVPPLLRQEVKELTVSQENFYLTYMVNSGYGEEVLTFARNNPEVKIKAFWDKKGAAENEYPLPNLSFHQVIKSFWQPWQPAKDCSARLVLNQFARRCILENPWSWCL
jgi:hypothetical protein